MFKDEAVYTILDALEDAREEEDVMEALKREYPNIPNAFILAVIAFDREIQQLSLEKEPVAVVVHGEEWISNILEISERGLLIEARTSEQGRGSAPRLVSISQAKRWIYE